jgi:hypothetical protein
VPSITDDGAPSASRLRAHRPTYDPPMLDYTRARSRGAGHTALVDRRDVLDA